MARYLGHGPLNDARTKQIKDDLRMALHGSDASIITENSLRSSRTQKELIYKAGLPQAWDSFRQFRNILQYEIGSEGRRPNPELCDKTLVPLVRANALARAAFALEGIYQGIDKDKSLEIADKQLEQFSEELGERYQYAPYSYIDKPIAEAVNAYNHGDVYGKIRATYLGAYALSVSAAVEHRLI